MGKSKIDDELLLKTLFKNKFNPSLMYYYAVISVFISYSSSFFLQNFFVKKNRFVRFLE